MRRLLLGVVLVGLSVVPSFAQVSPSDFVFVETDHPSPPHDTAWLNLRHMHSIQPCNTADGVHACVHMDADEVHNNPRIFRSLRLYHQAVRDILSLPNPTTPTAVVSGPDAAMVGEPITLTVEVTDPDYGDSWTYQWSESSATMNGGTFGDFQAATTTYTPAMVGTVIVALRVIDDAQQFVTVSHQVTVTE